jgi:predicted GH43/DUF377 family glycosyl hydrolase
MFVVKRSIHNPILVPNRDHHWEEFATFNMSTIKRGKIIYGLYRAISAVDHVASQPQFSTIGVAESRDGIHFENRRQFITPAEDWDMCGCEDPRTTLFEGTYYTFYTALSQYPFGPDGIKVAVAVSDDLKTVKERHLVTPFNAKAMTLFPERINGKITAIFSAHTDIPPTPVQTSLVQVDRIEELWDSHFWEEWMKNFEDHAINFKRLDSDHTEIGAAPVKTKYGWLLVYSHIQNYGSREPVFGTEAILLDFKDPKKILGRTKGQILAPEEPYEHSGYVPNIVFPTGVIVDKNTMSIYYGAADTTACVAHVYLDDLLASIYAPTAPEWKFKRSEQNPILLPVASNQWESKAVFNPAALFLNNKTHILYRALSEDNTSTIGYAISKDGVSIDERLPNPIYVPREDFENKKISGGNSGCEDPRLTVIKTEIYMCYTAYDGIGLPRVATTKIKVKDFLEKKWNWSKPILITPPGFDDKDTCLLPQKFKQGYLILHRVSNEICSDYLKSLDFGTDIVSKCIHILGPRYNMWDSAKVGITAPPYKTRYGWLMLYHGVSHTHGTYRVGAVLLDLKDPNIILARSSDPIFEPEEPYEREGIVNNVVFPCGMIVRKGTVYIYYGGGDKVVGVATMKLSTILDALVHGAKLK